MPEPVATKLLTKVELAAAFQVHAQTVVVWGESGLPIAQRGHRGRASLYSLPDCVKWFIARELQHRGVADERLDPYVERARLDKARREAVEFELGIKQGRYLLAFDVEVHWSRILVELRNFLRGLPSRLRTAATLSDAQARTLAEYIDRALTDLADQHAHGAREEEEEIDASANGHGPVSRRGPRDPEPVAGPLSAPVGG